MLLRVRRALFTLAVLSVLLAGCGDSKKQSAPAPTPPAATVAQTGPMIMDNRGEVVWFKPLNTRGVTDFRVQHYLGKPVLTWWRGHVSNMGVGDGWYVIYDTSYRPVAEVRAGN